MKYIKLFENYINEKFPRTDSSPDESSRQLIDEFEEEFEDLGFPDGTEETSASYTKTAVITLDMRKEVFHNWRISKYALDKEKSQKFLISFDKSFFSDDETEIYKYVFYNITPPPKLKKFSEHRGYSVFLMSSMSLPGDPWVQLIVVFSSDKEAAQRYKSRIQGRKYGI